MLEPLTRYLAMGGFVMPALVLVGLLLWTLIGLRMQVLRRGFMGDLIIKTRELFLDPAQARHPAGLLDDLLRRGVDEVRAFGQSSRKRLDLLVLESEQELGRYRKTIRSLCGAAPLLGLLGTVSGMIETFCSLTSMELFSQSGGVAGGIAEALISTQMGLFVAIPGVIVGRLLDRKEEAIRMEMHRAREHLMQVACALEREAA
ncbi:MAG: MotA/TolQ/ExbB proton channel family protein [Deltaproteobacteria bacterium]|nr:MotA/TolQ/ExbB proton channel family protein [Deltaproteobacteria bacterium]